MKESTKEKILEKIAEYCFVTSLVLILVGGYLYGWLTMPINTPLYLIMIVNYILMAVALLFWYPIMRRNMR